MTDEPADRPGTGDAGPPVTQPETDRGPDGVADRGADRGRRVTRRELEDRLAGTRGRKESATEDAADGPPWAWGERRRRAGGEGQLRGRGFRGRRGGPWPATGERPEWWPADDAWPPRRPHPWRGFGCLFGLLFLAGVLGLLSLGTTIAGRLLETPGPLGLIVRIASIGVAAAVIVALARAARAMRGSGTVLDALVDQAARVEAGDYRARVQTVGTVPGPVRALARGFNTMAARLEADETQRRSLLADVTHELRTPLAVVRGSVEAILDGVHPADDAHLGAILEETRILDRLIEDLRTLALSESGGLSLHREPTDLGVLVGDVATSFAAAATAGGVELATATDDLPLLDVDPVRIREVVVNLVANALRHTPAGGRIEIRAGRVADLRSRPPAGNPDEIEITVRDTGSGIDPELLPHVFDRFARGADSTGSGLGLSIARGLVELHGGTIAASSAAGGGTEIRVRLPVAPPR